MATIQKEALLKIPYVNHNLESNRTLVTLNFFVQGKWRCWFPVNGGVQELCMKPAEAHYFGDKPERPTDCSYKILNLLAQHAVNTKNFHFFNALWNDFQDLTCILAKINFFYKHKDDIGDGIMRYVQTEIEYLIIKCKSVYDLLQEIIISLCERIVLADGSKIKNLPGTFSKIVFSSGNLRSKEEIVIAYRLPDALAEWYVSYGRCFDSIRNIRDVIVHGGNSLPSIYSTDSGFAIDRKNGLFDGLYDWPQKCELENSLVPIRPVIAGMIKDTLDACNGFPETLKSIVVMPKEISPGLMVYSRGYNDNQLQLLERVVSESLWDSEV